MHRTVCKREDAGVAKPMWNRFTGTIRLITKENGIRTQNAPMMPQHGKRGSSATSEITGHAEHDGNQYGINGISLQIISGSFYGISILGSMAPLVRSSFSIVSSDMNW